MSGTTLNKNKSKTFLTHKWLISTPPGWPQHCILKGHHGNVTSLLYPYGYSKAYNSNYLVSGGADFTVKLWDLYSGDLVADFAVHGGKVKNIISCPPDVNVRTCTCMYEI